MNARVKRRTRQSAEELDNLVLKVIERSNRPVSAYYIADSSKILGKALVPTQVYRSLNRLMEHRRVERIAKLNAYATTCFRHSVHLLCSGCGSYQADDGAIVQEQLAEICKGAGFKRRMIHLEIVGLCRRCQLDSCGDVI